MSYFNIPRLSGLSQKLYILLVRHFAILHVCFVFNRVTARSISEEFSSGDQARLRDEEYSSSKQECSSSHRNDSSHKSDNAKDPKKDKDKEEKDEGMLYKILIQKLTNIFFISQKQLKCLTATTLCEGEYFDR